MCDERVTEYMGKTHKSAIEIDSKRNDLFPYGPVNSQEGKDKIFEAISTSALNIQPVYSSKSISDTNYGEILKMENTIQYKLIPTLIRDSLKDVLEVDEDEANRYFYMGPLGSQNFK